MRQEMSQGNLLVSGWKVGQIFSNRSVEFQLPLFDQVHDNRARYGF